MPRARPSPRAVVSKLAEMEARVLLPLGEGGPKGRMRVHFLPPPGASRPPLPKGGGHPRKRFPNRESRETRNKPASGANRVPEFGHQPPNSRGQFPESRDLRELPLAP